MLSYMLSHILGSASHKYSQRHLIVLQTFAVMPAEHNQEAKLKPFFFIFHFPNLFSFGLKSGYCGFHSAWNNKLIEDCLCGQHTCNYHNSILTHC